MKVITSEVYTASDAKIDYKEKLLSKIKNISDGAAEELDLRIQTLPAKELVTLLSSSVQLQSIIEREIAEEKAKNQTGSEETIKENKYENLSLNQSKVQSLLLQ